MGLFSKKCSVCGGTAGALSSRKIENGVLCGDCVNKLSPWFDGLRNANEADIRSQISFRQQNRKNLDSFRVTKAWGVKKYRTALQFVYDGESRQFVIVEGPVEDPDVDFREKNPDIISFDQVKDVWLEVDEYWTEGKGEFEPKPIDQRLTQDKYDEVFWRYDFYLNLETTHPYAERIRYKMNFKPTILKIPQRGPVFRRGVDIGGNYRGEEIDILAARLEAFGGREEKIEEGKKLIDVFLLKNKGEGSLEKIRDGLIKDAGNEIYFRKIANMGAHAARAARISKLLLGM